MNKLKIWQSRLFYLILFLLPTNLAKHFPLSSSYVSGILVDYLIPTFYLTDILIIALLFLWFISRLKSPQTPLFRPSFKLSRSPYLIFLLLLLPSVILSSSPLPAVYKLLKLFQFTLLALWIKQHQPSTKLIIRSLTLAVLFQSTLAIAQWFNQSSIFGYWFLGEQPYTPATPGIDTITWFDGSLKIPPLGTLPHPNVLGGFLALTIPLLISRFSSKLSLMTAFLGSLALFLTFSLSAWLALLLIGLPATLLLTYQLRQASAARHQQLSLIRQLPRFNYWQQVINAHTTQPTNIRTSGRGTKSISVKIGLFYLIILIPIVIFFKNLSFLAPQSSFTRRSQLATISLAIFKQHSLTGIGLNNFTAVMENYGYISATTRFLQPVHNIFLLILSETGLIGLIGFLCLLLSPLITRQRPLFLIPYLSLLFLGLFDHYPLTIQPSILLLFILFGLLNQPASTDRNHYQKTSSNYILSGASTPRR